MPFTTASGRSWRPLVALVAICSLLAAACSTDESAEGSATSDPGTLDARGLVMLQGVGTAEIDPFTDPVTNIELEGFPDVVLAAVDASLATAQRDAATGTRQLAGDAPGLYGGSGDDAVCDLTALADHLLDDDRSEQAEAFADVVDVEAGELTELLAGLTPVVLTADTLVTNHGYRAGRATPFPAILQAGTAVAVDRNGVPLVKCGCGNPLAPPSGQVELVPDMPTSGEAWPDFRVDEVTTVAPSSEEIDEFTVIDVETGDLEELPSGSDVDGRGGPAESPEDCFVDADGHGPDCEVDGRGGPAESPEDCFIDADGHGPDCDVDGRGGPDDLRYLSGWDVDATGFDRFTAFTVTCPPNGAPGPVYGSGPYGSSSSLCTAAVHAGRITLAGGGTVGGQAAEPSGPLTGSTANGVTSRPADDARGAFEIF